MWLNRGTRAVLTRCRAGFSVRYHRCRSVGDCTRGLLLVKFPFAPRSFLTTMVGQVHQATQLMYDPRRLVYRASYSCDRPSEGPKTPHSARVTGDRVLPATELPPGSRVSGPPSPRNSCFRFFCRELCRGVEVQFHLYFRKFFRGHSPHGPLTTKLGNVSKVHWQ